jgi:RNA polymerase sigma-70 factor (ECF subfamily)
VAWSSDAEAIARARDGDAEAFRALFDRYQGRVYRLALRVLRDEEKARDAAQESFLKVFRTLRRFEGRSSFYTWLYRLALNVCLDMRRRDRSDREVEWSEPRSLDAALAAEVLPDAPLASAPEGPAAAIERKELRRVLAEAMEALPESARETLRLREIDGLSYREIADVLGIPKGTVMSRLHYARRRVQRELESAGFGADLDAAPEPSGEREPR